MKFITTENGFYDYANPSTVYLDDIAHSLARQCRYLGHTKKHYSVAQHCVHIAELLETRGHPREFCLLGLLHDAPEAFFGDLPSPLKREMTPEVKKWFEDKERPCREAICRQWLPSYTENDLLHNPVIHALDKAICYEEARLYLSQGLLNWPPQDGEPFPRGILPDKPWTVTMAHHMYLHTFHRLRSK